MPAPRQPRQRAQRQKFMQRLHYLVAAKWWNKEDPQRKAPAYVMIAVGPILIVLGIVAALNRYDISAGLLLLFGFGLLIYGGMLLLFALIEWIANLFIYDKKYCGCCTFYHPVGDDYSLGLCRSVPGERHVQRTHYCPSFRYSERAMVRDRLWQKRYVLHQIRAIQVDSEQAGSDD